MTATPVLLTKGGDTTNGTVYSTAAISPGPTRVLYVGVLASAPSGGTTGVPTLSADVGQTWELILQTPTPDAIRTAFVFRSTTTSSPSSGPLTLTFPNTIGSLVWGVYEVDGADLAAPTVQSIQERRQGGTNTSVNFAFASPVDPANATLAFVGISADADITPGSGWTAGGTTARITAPTNSLLSMHATSAQQNVQASWTGGSNTWVIGVEVKAAGTVATPTLLSRWVGAVTTGSATVAVKTSGTSSARLKVATDSALTTGVVFGSAATPDANGYAKLPVTGLAAGTTYYYGVELDGTVDAARGSFRTFPSGAASFAFGFGSCTNDVDSDTFARVQARDPDLFVHLGDFRYLNPYANDPSLFRGMYDEGLTAVNESALYANTPTAYVWSDHDFAGGSNAWSGGAPKPAAQSTFRQVVPHYPLPDAAGIYQTFVVGRVRFILSDLRSYRSDPTTVDDASKTMMGAVQKQWWKDTITNATEPVIVWGTEVPWICDATAPDTWGGYQTERAELAAFVQASGKRVVVISGDMHALAADDGTNSAGGLPVFQAAPFINDTNTKPGTYSAGIYSGTGVGRFYGWMDVTDDGTTVTLAFTGYDTTDTARITQTVVVAPAVPEGSATGDHTWSGSASGSAEHQGTAQPAGSHTWTGAASGSAEHSGSTSGDHTWTAQIAGSTEHQGTTSVSHTWSGSASGWKTSRPVSTLIEAWNTLDPAKWSNGGTAFVSGGQLHCPRDNGPWAGAVYSTDRLDVTGSLVFIELVEHSTGPAYTDSYFQLNDGAGGTIQKAVSIDVENASVNLYRARGDGGWDTYPGTPYDPVAHRYLGFRHDGTSLMAVASPDAQTWTTLHTWDPAIFGFDLSAAFLSVGSGGDQPGDAVFDNLNIVPAAGSASGSHTWTGTASGVAPAEGVNSGSAQGTHTWTGSASGTTDRSGSASGSWTTGGTAAGSTDHSGTAATGTHTWTGSAAGNVPAAAPEGSAQGSHTWTGSASGTAEHAGSASGSWAVTGTASGGRPLGSPEDICITWGPLRTRTLSVELAWRELDTDVATRTLSVELAWRELDTDVATRTLATTLEEC